MHSRPARRHTANPDLLTETTHNTRFDLSAAETATRAYVYVRFRRHF